MNFTYVTAGRGALVEPAAPGQWNSNGLTYVLGTPHLSDGGREVVLYFWGTNSNHNGVRDPAAPGNRTVTSIASARMRLDGFVHLAPVEDTAAAPAVVLTRPLTYGGDTLRLNADAVGSGQIVVAVESLSGRTLQRSKWFSFNDVNGTVEWERGFGAAPAGQTQPGRQRDEADLRSLAGTPVRLRFFIKRAKLYAFQFV